MTSEKDARRSGRLPSAAGAALGLAFALAGACDGPAAGVPVGSNTNWLVTCGATADCGGDGACVCGACSLECASDADCSELPGARCALADESATRSQCRSDTPDLASGMCLARCEPGACTAEQACVEGACVVALPADAELCTTLPTPDEMTRARQDALLALIETLRSTGGVVCGSAAASVPVPPLRWDPRLACTARALAADMASTGSLSLIDSAGRDTVARLALVGYPQRTWGEAFAITPGGEDAALAAMQSDVDSCGRFVSAALTEVGVGNVDDAYVVTIASE